MIDSALNLLQQAMGSPWVYLVLAAMAAVDSFFPVIPGEVALITVAVFAAPQESVLVMAILAGVLGAFVGDHVSYLIGRGALGRFHDRIRRNSRSRAAYDWASSTLSARGGQVLLASRYVPGVRTATTITMGGVRYTLWRFSLWDILAASFWATGWSLLGYLGGAAFGSDPLKGLAFGIGLALVLMLLSEGVRRLLRARRSRRPGATEGVVAECDSADQ